RGRGSENESWPRSKPWPGATGLRPWRWKPATISMPPCIFIARPVLKAVVRCWITRPRPIPPSSRNLFPSAYRHERTPVHDFGRRARRAEGEENFLRRIDLGLCPLVGAVARAQCFCHRDARPGVGDG